MKTEATKGLRSELAAIRVHHLKDYTGASYVPLPRALWQSAGRCDCSVCKGKEGFYDTLGVPHQNGPNGAQLTWLLHWPELQTKAN